MLLYLNILPKSCAESNSQITSACGSGSGRSAIPFYHILFILSNTAGLDGIPQTASEAGKAAYFVPEEIRYQDAGTAVLRGLQLMQEGKTCGYMELQPDYMRMAEAERKLREKQAKEAEAARKAVTEQGAPAERAERTGGERNNG